MSNQDAEQKVRNVQGMFSQIAVRYDFMNRLMTAGQDMRWRREVINRADLPPKALVLDIGTGTGDLVIEALNKHPDCQPVAVDFTFEMMKVGQAKFNKLTHQNDRVNWTAADALVLPFADDVFDAVISGFLLRNVVGHKQTLKEQYRVLKHGGILVALDTTRPRKNIISPFTRFHLHFVIPMLGRMMTGKNDAYKYLPSSTEAFLSAEELACLLVETGCKGVRFQRLMGGVVALHWGSK